MKITIRKNLNRLLFVILSTIFLSCSNDSEMKVVENEEIYFSYKKSGMSFLEETKYKINRDTITVKNGKLPYLFDIVAATLGQNEKRFDLKIPSNEEFQMKLYFKNNKLTDEERFSKIMDIFQQEKLIEIK